MLIGAILLIAVTALAIGIGIRANRSVQQFREEEHESFTRRDSRHSREGGNSEPLDQATG